MADDIPQAADRVSAAKIDIIAVARGFIVGLGGASPASPPSSTRAATWSRAPTSILNAGASIQLDQNTVPPFELIRQGACMLMETVRGQAAVATNNACVESGSERLDTGGLAHSVINIRAAEGEVRVTVIEGQVQMLRPGVAMVYANPEYIATEGGRWHAANHAGASGGIRRMDQGLLPRGGATAPVELPDSGAHRHRPRHLFHQQGQRRQPADLHAKSRIGEKHITAAATITVAGQRPWIVPNRSR